MSTLSWPKPLFLPAPPLAHQGCPITLWEPVTGCAAGSLSGGGAVGSVLDLATSPDDCTLLAAGSDGAIRAWDLNSSRIGQVQQSNARQ